MPAKTPKVTSKQVAERAGVSQTTVSFVLNGVENSNISDETRQRVLAAVRDLNYVPNARAQSLARGRSNNIALVLGNPHRQVFIDEYIPAILTGLNEAIQPQGFRILVELLPDMTDSDALATLIRGGEIAGMVVSNVTMPDEVAHLVSFSRANFPIVLLDYVHPDVYSVTVDKLAGTRSVVEHLVKLGHRRIACISYGPLERGHPAQRLAVYQKVLEKAGIAYDEALVRIGAFDPETGCEAMKSLLPLRPTAVFAMNDLMAFGALTAIREAGLRVPEDIAVAGFDDIRLARYAIPPLTTVHEPDSEHGRQAGDLLLKLINGNAPPEKHVRLATRLIVRESCGGHLRGSGAKEAP